MAVEQEVISIVAEQLGVDENDVTPSKKFIEDLNADSLDLTELVMALEEEFDVEIKDEVAAKIKTVQDAINFVNSARAAK